MRIVPSKPTLACLCSKLSPAGLWQTLRLRCIMRQTHKGAGHFAAAHLYKHKILPITAAAQHTPLVRLCWEPALGQETGRLGSFSPTYLVGVPQADGAAQGELPHQQIVHPTKGKLQVFDLILPKVIVYLL